MDEILKRDENHVTVLGAITNDSSQEIRMIRVDPATGRVLADATGLVTAVTLADVSSDSTTTASSLYSMSSGVNVEFEDSSNNRIIEIIESSKVILLGSGSSIGNFTSPSIQLGSSANGIYLDANRIFFKAGGVFGGGMSSVGFQGNSALVDTIVSLDDLTKPRFIPYRLNATSIKSGLGGNSSGDIALITNNIARLTISVSGLATFANDNIVITTAKTPSSASDTGTQGSIAWDSDYIYVCVATNTWKRSAISTW